ncbi:MAG: DUF1080 domain-containing protein, partial [Bacteroidia bacterium]|nr:DUF1080 domain-containing protein [Bacteroidia bacterium]
MKKLIILFSIAIIIYSCKTDAKKVTEEKISSQENEWTELLDNSRIDGWRAYNGDDMPPGWLIEGNTLTFKTEQILEEDYDYKGSRDIIYGTEEFDNFELYVEWKIPEGGNSGIFYHVKEGYNGPPEVAPEYQLIDDANYARIHDLTAYNKSLGASEPAKLQDWQSTAADYA